MWRLPASISQSLKNQWGNNSTELILFYEGACHPVISPTQFHGNRKHESFEIPRGCPWPANQTRTSNSGGESPLNKTVASKLSLKSTGKCCIKAASILVTIKNHVERFADKRGENGKKIIIEIALGPEYNGCAQ